MDFGKWLRVQWDRAVSVVCMVLGAVFLLLGWRGISGTPYPAEQLPYILSAGIGGIFLLGVGATFWLSADLRDEWSKLDSIDESLQQLAGSSLVNHKAMGNGYAKGGDPFLEGSPTDPDYAMASAPTRRPRPLRAGDAGVVRRRLADDGDGV
jgi:hypothetical protein